MGDDGERLHDWMFGGASETGQRIQQEMFASAGAVVIGRRMFDLGKPHWDPDPETFRRLPVFVLTHRPEAPIVDEGGSTFTFASDGVEDALAQARAAAAERDVVVGGGASIARQFVQIGLLDELRIHLVHLLLGAGERLLDFDDHRPRSLRATRVIEDAGVTHFRFGPD